MGTIVTASNSVPSLQVSCGLGRSQDSSLLLYTRETRVMLGERCCLTNVAADKHFIGCGFAAMVVVCLQLN